MATSDSDILRDMLGEPIPEGETDSSTLFSDQKITELLLLRTADGKLYAAAAEGWDRKASLLSNLVDQQQGGSARSMNQAYKAAVERAEHYRELSLGRRGTRIGKIKRAGTTLT